MHARPDVSNVEKMWSKTEGEKERQRGNLFRALELNLIEPLRVMHEYIR